MPRPRLTARTFWARVDKSAGLDACWPWTWSRNSEGYGRAKLDGRSHPAHRMAYRLARGPIPDGLLVLHSCDNPPCCNPRHLRVGTPKDNGLDTVIRRRRGVLTDDDLEAIFVARTAGQLQSAIAQRLGVDQSLISRVLSGEYYAYRTRGLRADAA